MASADMKLLENSSPQKIGKTGNVVLDRINQEVEFQRDIQAKETIQDDYRFEIELNSKADAEESVMGAIGTAQSDRKDIPQTPDNKADRQKLSGS